jgi:hypothetical protein
LPGGGGGGRPLADRRQAETHGAEQTMRTSMSENDPGSRSPNCQF